MLAKNEKCNSKIWSPCYAGWNLIDVENSTKLQNLMGFIDGCKFCEKNVTQLDVKKTKVENGWKWLMLFGDI